MTLLQLDNDLRDTDLLQLMKQNPQALLLLNILSCLPSGTSRATLRWWVLELNSSMIPSAIATLSKTGLLVENRRQDSDSPRVRILEHKEDWSPVLFVLPVIQSFMQQHGRIREDIRQNIPLSCSKYVLDHYHRNLAAEDVSLFSSPTSQHSNMLSDKVIDALISFSWY